MPRPPREYPRRALFFLSFRAPSRLRARVAFLFFLSLEKSFDYLADSILNQSGIDLPNAGSFNTQAKWNKLGLEPSLKNIIFKEEQPDGFIFDFYNAKDKLLTPINDSLITSNQSSNLKKYISILDSYKRFTLLLRKTLDEC